MSGAPAVARLGVVAVGHVDHGKSTLLGRLLADSGALPDGKLQQVREHCRRHARPFEYAFLLDALREEQAQGVTVDVARVFLRAAGQDLLLIDAPGHADFVRNMVSGAARADAALLVVDAREGLQENARRHGALLALLGVRQLLVLVNKMDLVDFSEARFLEVQREVTAFLAQAGLVPAGVLPTAGATGANVVQRAPGLAWFSGPTLLEALGTLQPLAPPVDAPFRLWVQDVYKFTARGDERRIVAGSVASGQLRAGDRLRLWPGGRSARVQALEAFPPRPLASVRAGEAVGFTLEGAPFVQRGELITREDEPAPLEAGRLRARLFWLGPGALREGAALRLKLGTAQAAVQVEAVHAVLDAHTLQPREEDAHAARPNDLAEVTLLLERPLAFDCAAALPATGRFVLVEGYRAVAGGRVLEALAPAPARAAAWRAVGLGAEARAAQLGQRAVLLLVRGAGAQEAVAGLEAQLLARGQPAYACELGEGAPADFVEAVRAQLAGGLLVLAAAPALAPEAADLLAQRLGPGRVLGLEGAAPALLEALQRRGLVRPD